jgi:hypothetical protein
MYDLIGTVWQIIPTQNIALMKIETTKIKMHINNYKICHTLFLHGSLKLYVMCFHPFKCASAILEISINIFFELFMNRLQL